MKDVAKVLKIEPQKAEQIVKQCYITIAKLQSKGTKGQVIKTIEAVHDIGKTMPECFYTGFMLGRIIQINATAKEGIETFLEDQAKHLAWAHDEIAEHQEFA